MTTFSDLDLIEPLRRALAIEHYHTPTPIQEQAIPLLLEGRDVLGCAQTGTGKTAAFALPVLQRLSKVRRDGAWHKIRALVLSPTRELAAQIEERFRAYGRYLGLRCTVIVGGVSQRPQLSALQRGVDVLVATPGRLLDLCGQGAIDLQDVSFFVLDEADRMLDMGFIHDIRRVLALLPGKRQNLLFSATMPRSIIELAGAFLHDPAEISVTPETPAVETVTQQVMFVEKADKKDLLAHLLRRAEVTQSIVFTRTKHGANRLVKQLDREGIEAVAIHGNKSQNAREGALLSFRNGEIPILVATDIASRGIDVDGVSHVFNYELPNEPESYVHRIGRTGRAGRTGIAIALCDASEGAYLRDIERLTRVPIEVVRDQPWHCEAAIPPPHRTNERAGRHGRPYSGSRAAPAPSDRPARAFRRQRPSRPYGNTSTDAPHTASDSTPQRGEPQDRTKPTDSSGGRNRRGRWRPRKPSTNS